MFPKGYNKITKSSKYEFSKFFIQKRNSILKKRRKKVPSALSTPLTPQSRGLGVSFCHVSRHNSLMSILQDIFRDHYEEMIYTLHPRSSVIENVDKMINCGDLSYGDGGAMYGCPGCGSLKFVPFRCHSRFCPSCGVKYSIDRTTSMSFKIIESLIGIVFLPLLKNYDRSS